MGKPSAPTPPSPQATAQAQEQANSQSALQTAELNRINQYTPYGSSTYSVSGYNADGTPQYNQSTTLAPAQQQLLNLSNQGQIALGNTAVGQLGQVANSFANPLNISGAPGIASSVNSQGQITGQVQGQGNQQQAIQQAENAAYGQQAQYLDPQFSQAHEKLDNSLINQGITQGSENYNNSQLNLNNQQQQAYGNAAMQAVQAGQNEQNTLFGQGLSASQLQNAAQQQSYGQGLSSANLQNAAQAQYLQQQIGLQNQPLNQYNALMTGAQVQNPTFNSVPQSQVANTDVAGITNSAYANQLAAYQQNQAGINNLFSLGGSLGSAAIFASDRRLKRDIERIGETPGGLPIYSFKYIRDGERAQIFYGVMADEVAPVIPEAVHYDADGFASVDYSRVK